MKVRKRPLQFSISGILIAVTLAAVLTWITPAAYDWLCKERVARRKSETATDSWRELTIGGTRHGQRLQRQRLGLPPRESDYLPRPSP